MEISESIVVAQPRHRVNPRISFNPEQPHKFRTRKPPKPVRIKLTDKVKWFRKMVNDYPLSLGWVVGWATLGREIDLDEKEIFDSLCLRVKRFTGKYQRKWVAEGMAKSPQESLLK